MTREHLSFPMASLCVRSSAVVHGFSACIQDWRHGTRVSIRDCACAMHAVRLAGFLGRRGPLAIFCVATAGGAHVGRQEQNRKFDRELEGEARRLDRNKRSV